MNVTVFSTVSTLLISLQNTKKIERLCVVDLELLLIRASKNYVH